MNTKFIITSMAALLLMSGCSGRAGQNMSMYHDGERESSRGGITGSIFSSDLQLAKNEDIAQVLDGVVPMKEHGGLAVLPIGNLYFINAGYSDSLNTTIGTTLKDNKYIGNIVQIPRLLMNQKITASTIREMGARLLCENVLVYTAYNDSRYDRNLFTKDVLRVNLTVEVILFNVRTGCIPVAVSSDQSGIIKETNKDFDEYEFTRRAYRECLTNGIIEACKKIDTVLSKVD